MSEMPKTIFASKSVSGDCVVSFSTPSDNYQIEYRRADLPLTSDQLLADPRVKALVELLTEARSDLAVYVDQEYPPDTCADYPDIARRHFRDMELCRQIDAALAQLKEPKK